MPLLYPLIGIPKIDPLLLYMNQAMYYVEVDGLGIIPA